MLAFGRTAGPASAAPVASGVALSQGRVDAAGLKPQVAAAPKHHFGFRELLSDLNPLQYIPGIGTLFRAITGDVVPESVRDVGSLVVSTVIGGPVGAALDLGELVAEKVTGIDPEKIGDKLLADIGIGGKTKAAAPAVPAVPAVRAVQVAMTSPPVIEANAAVAWSPSQLAAYGVTTTARGNLQQGDLSGSDVLNGLELDQIRARQAIAQYDAAKSA